MAADDEHPLNATGAIRFAPYLHYRLAYEDVPATGKGDQLPPLVGFHDALVGRGEFAAFRSTLNARFGADRPRLILPEARGHGASAALAGRGYTHVDLLGESLAMFEHAAVPSAVLIGHGLGGATALLTAIHAPERVMGLVLVEPALPTLVANDPDPATQAAARSWLEADQAAALAAYQGRADAALDSYLTPRWGAGWRECIPAGLLGVLRRHVGALAGTLDALASLTVSDQELATMTVPTHIRWRAEAPLPLRAVSELVTAAPPNAQGQALVMNDASQLTMLDEGAIHDLLAVVAKIYTHVRKEHD